MTDVERVSLVEQTTRVEQITGALKEFINSNEINVGEKMPSEADLCAKHNVSRTTIREALRFLQALGYVELIPNKGAYVANKHCGDINDARDWMLSHAKEVIDVLEARSVFEPKAASLAAEHASETERFTIMGIKTLFESAAREGNQGAMALYDEKLHEAIIYASHNNFFRGVNDVMAKALRHFRGRTFSIDTHGKIAIDAHEKVVNAIMQRNSKNASKYMYEHMEQNIEAMEKSTLFRTVC